MSRLNKKPDIISNKYLQLATLKKLMVVYRYIYNTSTYLAIKLCVIMKSRGYTQSGRTVVKLQASIKIK